MCACHSVGALCTYSHIGECAAGAWTSAWTEYQVLSRLQTDGLPGRKSVEEGKGEEVEISDRS